MGVTLANFQEEGKYEWDISLLNSCDRGPLSCSFPSLNSLGETRSGPVALEGSMSGIASETSIGVM